MLKIRFSLYDLVILNYQNATLLLLQAQNLYDG